MRLIDADKIHPDVRTQRGGLAISQGQLAYAKTVNAILIPDNATNGDVIKALFPQIVTQEILDGEIIVINGIVDCSMAFGREMWNAPYKAESEEQYVGED